MVVVGVVEGAVVVDDGDNNDDEVKVRGENYYLNCNNLHLFYFVFIDYLKLFFVLWHFIRCTQ